MKVVSTVTHPQSVKDSVRRLYEAKKEYEKAESYYKTVKEKESVILSNYMFSCLPKGTKSFEIYMDEGADFYTKKRMVGVSQIRRTKIIWDAEKLRQKVSDRVYRSVTKRTYTINNINGLIEYLKTCNVNPKIFKKYINVDVSVDDKAIEQAYQVGDIKRKDVESCYSIEMGDPYIKMTDRNNG